MFLLLDTDTSLFIKVIYLFLILAFSVFSSGTHHGWEERFHNLKLVAEVVMYSIHKRLVDLEVVSYAMVDVV